MKRLKLACCAFACILAITSFTGYAEARLVNVAVGGHVALIAFHSAIENGYYKQEDLDVKLILTRAPVASQALIGGSVDFSTSGGNGLSAILAGAPIRILFTSFHRPMASLWVRDNVRDIKELKGKKVGLPGGPGSGYDTNLREVLRVYGVEEDREVAIVGITDSAATLPALRTGAVDAAVLAAQYSIRAEEAGFRELLIFTREDLKLVQHQGSIIAREELLKSDPVFVEKFVKATLKGFLYTRANPARAVPAWSRYNRIKQDDGQKMFTKYFLPSMTLDGTLTKESQERGVAQYTKRTASREITLEKIFDNSFIRRARAQLVEGWKPGSE